MDNTNVAPVDHSAGSAFASTVGGGAGGALKGGIKGALGAWGTVALIGAGIGLFAGLLLTGIIALPAAGAITWGFAGFAKALLIGGLTIGGGTLAATTIGPWAATAGGVVGGGLGAAKGVSRASDQVTQERAAAAGLNAQVDMYKAQAANDNKYNFPEQGSAMNQAGTTVNNVVLADRVAGQQMQRA